MARRKPLRLMHVGDDVKVTILESVKEARENMRKGITGLLWVYNLSATRFVPMELQAAILSKSEAKKVVELKSVCKDWAKTVDTDPLFLRSQVYSSRVNCKNMLVRRFSTEEDRMFSNIYSVNNVQDFSDLCEIPDLYPASFMTFLGSNYGVVFLAREETLFLWNAWIRKGLKVEEKGKTPLTVSVAFVKTNSVLAGIFRSRDHKLEAGVVTLADRAWKTFHPSGLQEFDAVSQINVLINGKLYFFCGKGQTQTNLQVIGSIDIEDPSLTLSVISLPENLEKSLKVVGELHGVLCVCAVHGEKLRVWKRDESGQEWNMFLDQDCPDASSWDCISVALDTLVLTKESSLCLYNFVTGFHQCNIQGCRDVFPYPQSLFLSREEGCCDQVSIV